MNLSSRRIQQLPRRLHAAFIDTVFSRMARVRTTDQVLKMMAMAPDSFTWRALALAKESTPPNV